MPSNSKTKTSLQVALRYFLDTFRPSAHSRVQTTPIPDSELLAYHLPPRREIDVKYYMDLLRIQIESTEASRASLERHRVVRLTQYQDHRFLALQREFLIADVQDPDGGHWYIRIRRDFEHDSMVATRGKPPDEADEDRHLALEAFSADLKSFTLGRRGEGATLGKKLPLALSLLSGSFTSRVTFNADDFLVDVVEDQPFTETKDDICLLEASQLDASWKQVATVEPQSLYLYQLATVAFVVQKRDFLYSPLADQPFWYAAMIIGVVRHMDANISPDSVVSSNLAPQEVYLTPRSVTHGENNSSPNHITSLVSRSDNDGRRFKVVKIPITHAYPVMIELLDSSARTEIQTLSELIQSVEERDTASIRKINDEIERTLLETACLKERLDRADEALALIREIKKSKRAQEAEREKKVFLESGPPTGVGSTDDICSCSRT